MSRLGALRSSILPGSKRDQIWRVGEVEIRLPYDHPLPEYQTRHPEYDRYFLPIIGALADQNRCLTVIDVGANVGDTAAAVLSTSNNVNVLAVEGDPHYGRYLDLNLHELDTSRVQIIHSFVGTFIPDLNYQSARGTGGFSFGSDGSGGSSKPGGADESESDAVQSDWAKWISVPELMERCDAGALVWKSDTDGMDIGLVHDNWPVLNERCDAIWFEFDPALSVSSDEHERLLVEELSASNREIVIFDNFGRPMLGMSGSPAAGALRDLSRWLRLQRSGQVSTYYFDVWAFKPEVYTRPVHSVIWGVPSTSGDRRVSRTTS